MNTREKFEEMLTYNGMFPSQAKQVMDEAIPVIDNMISDYKFSWDRPCEEYPAIIYNVVYLTVKEVALKWINENIPLAWFKPMFE
jgi:hypothetical protein